MAEVNISTSNLLVTRLRSAFGLLRLRPFDTSTPEMRSRERHRRVALSATAAAMSKFVTLAVAMVSLPLTYHYLGVERYELWVTMSAGIAMLAFADLGVGNGLLNLIAQAYGKDDEVAAARAVSSAFFILFAVAAVIGLAFFALYSRIPWETVFNVTTPEASVELRPALAVVTVCFLLTFPLGIVPRVQMGYQEGFLNSLWLVGGNVLGLIGLLLVVNFKAGLPWLALAVMGGPLLAAVLNGIVLFGMQRPGLAPRWRNVSPDVAFMILRTGAFFLVLQAAYALAFTSDNIVAKQILPEGAVTEYSAVTRIFGIAPMLIEMFCYPLWPAYGEAAARADFHWVQRTLFKSIAIAGAVTGGLGILLVVSTPTILSLWIGVQFSPAFSFLLGCAVWSVLQVCGRALAVFLNGTNTVGFQAICAVLTAVTAFFMKIAFAKVIGLAGIVWSMVFAYALLTAVPFIIYVPRLLRQLRLKSENALLSTEP